MRKGLNRVAPATADELYEMSGGVIGLMKHFPVEGDKLGLDMRQAGIFCRNTPGGKKGLALWQEYITVVVMLGVVRRITISRTLYAK